jgi:hypothetical protein
MSNRSDFTRQGKPTRAFIKRDARNDILDWIENAMLLRSEVFDRDPGTDPDPQFTAEIQRQVNRICKMFNFNDSFKE